MFVAGVVVVVVVVLKIEDDAERRWSTACIHRSFCCFNYACALYVVTSRWMDGLCTRVLKRLTVNLK